MSTLPTSEGTIDDIPAAQRDMSFAKQEIAEGKISILAEQRGSRIEKIEDETIHQYGCSVAVEKFGYRVSRAEAEAMRLVQEHADVPSPRLLDTYFDDHDGQIVMSYIPGKCLHEIWEAFNEQSKELLCIELWKIIEKIRSIPRSPQAEGLFACLADGSPSHDPMIEDLQQPPRPIRNDDELRARIYERYLYANGRKYEKVLPDMLPRSFKSVFTHADIAPRNVMVNEEYQITGILDWENAGWYPDYWELANITAPASQCGDWQSWMVRTAPEEFRCDLQGINAARAVLF